MPIYRRSVTFVQLICCGVVLLAACGTNPSAPQADADAMASSPSVLAVPPTANAEIALRQAVSQRSAAQFAVATGAEGIVPAGEIFVIDNTNGASWRITGDPSRDFSPAWDPSGTILYFTSDREGIPYIHFLNAATAALPTRLSLQPQGDEREPVIAPDGFSVVFVSNRTGSDQIFRMSVDGGRQVVMLTSGEGNNTQPDWSPDGRWLVFTSDRDGNENIYLLDMQNPSLVRALTDDPANDAYPVFSPDATRIAFISERTGTTQVYTLSVPQPASAAFAQGAGAARDLTQPIVPITVDFAAPVPAATALTQDDTLKAHLDWYATAPFRTELAYGVRAADGGSGQIVLRSEGGTEFLVLGLPEAFFTAPAFRPGSLAP